METLEKPQQIAQAKDTITRRTFTKLTVLLPFIGSALLVSCGTSDEEKSFKEDFVSQLYVGNKAKIFDATTILTSVRRRGYPDVVVSKLPFQGNVVYITKPNQIEVVERPLYTKVKEIDWLIYFPPNNLSKIVCVAVDPDVDNRMRVSTDSETGILRYLKGNRIKEVRISDIAMEVMGNLKREALYFEENGVSQRIARSTIIER